MVMTSADKRKAALIETKVSVGPLRLATPIVLASGTCGYGVEGRDFPDMSLVGAIAAKGLTLHPRKGNPQPRIYETPAGNLNSVGLENVGIDAFIRDKLPSLSSLGPVVMANISGNSIGEYAEMAGKLADAEGLDCIEVNVSCPNVSAGGAAFGTRADLVKEIMAEVRKSAPNMPLGVKLSPNVTSITEIANAGMVQPNPSLM